MKKRILQKVFQSPSPSSKTSQGAFIVLATSPARQEVQEDVEVVLTPENVTSVDLEAGDAAQASGLGTLGVALELVLHLIGIRGSNESLAVKPGGIQHLGQPGGSNNIPLINPNSLVCRVVRKCSQS